MVGSCVGGRARLVVSIMLAATLLSACAGQQQTRPSLADSPSAHASSSQAGSPQASSADQATSRAPATAGTPDHSIRQSSDALAELDTLAVKGRAPKTGYSRAEFGAAWLDVNGNHCGTRIICTLERDFA